MRWSCLLLLLILLTYVTARGGGRGGGGRGGFGRGHSSARSGVRSGSRSHSSSFGGRSRSHFVRPQYRSYSGYHRSGTSGIYMMAAYGSLNRNRGRQGFRQQAQASYAPRTGGIAAGLLAGAVTGAVIADITSPVHFNGRPYYWQQRYYDESQYTAIYNQTCVVEIDEEDPDFGNVTMGYNMTVEQVVFGCFQGFVCCDFDCCDPTEFDDDEEEGNQTVAATVLVILLIGFGIYFGVKSRQQHGGSACCPPTLQQRVPTQDPDVRMSSVRQQQQPYA